MWCILKLFLWSSMWMLLVSCSIGHTSRKHPIERTTGPLVETGMCLFAPRRSLSRCSCMAGNDHRQLLRNFAWTISLCIDHTVLGLLVLMLGIFHQSGQRYRPDSHARSFYCHRMWESAFWYLLVVSTHNNYISKCRWGRLKLFFAFLQYHQAKSLMISTVG